MTTPEILAMPASRKLDAWLVLEKVACKKHWTFRIDSQKGYDSGPMYFVTIEYGKQKWEADSRWETPDDDGDSVPLAICRAALLTLDNL